MTDGEFKKRIKLLDEFEVWHDDSVIRDDVTKELYRILDEAKKEFPHLDELHSEWRKWFVKWFGGEKE